MVSSGGSITCILDVIHTVHELKKKVLTKARKETRRRDKKTERQRHVRDHNNKSHTCHPAAVIRSCFVRMLGGVSLEALVSYSLVLPSSRSMERERERETQRDTERHRSMES